MENSENSSTVGADPGSMLRKAREAMDISQREMADRLHWMPAYVGALEENRFELLPGAAFVRGYLRAYAKQINVDEVELLTAYESLPGVVESADEVQKRIETHIPQVQKKGWALPAGIGIVLALLLLLWLVQGEDEPASVPPSASANSAAETPAPLAAEPSPQDISLAPVEEAIADRVAMESELPAETEAAVALGADSELVTAADSVASIEPGEPLQFVFSGECWLEVRNGEDELIYADLRQAGDVLSLDGVPPFSVLIGDARYVELRYQGEPVVVQPRPGRIVARVVVGGT